MEPVTFSGFSFVEGGVSAAKGFKVSGAGPVRFNFIRPSFDCRLLSVSGDSSLASAVGGEFLR